MHSVFLPTFATNQLFDLNARNWRRWACWRRTLHLLHWVLLVGLVFGLVLALVVEPFYLVNQLQVVSVIVQF